MIAKLLRIFLGGLFIFAGVMHFVRPAAFISAVPEFLPFPDALVYISGVAEIAGGIGLLWERTRRYAAIGLILLLVAVYPANINMALNPQKFPQFPEWSLWMRLPVQFVLIWLVWISRK